MTIRLSWWGGDTRVKTTEEAVKRFEQEHPNIHVDMEYSDWTGYWDKLAMQSADGNAPDVMQMDELYLAFYGSMGSLLDLGKASDYLSDFGKGRQAMMITPYAQAAGTDNMTLVPMPQVKPGAKTMYLKPGMYWAISSRSQHPAEAAMLVDYLLNDPKAGEILGAERGIPANNDIRKSLATEAKGTDRAALDFVDKIQPMLGDSPAITPNGASELDKVIVRYQQNVVFGKRKSLDAAKSMIAELQESIDFAS